MLFVVLNHSTTIDTGASICGASGDMECRGADTDASRSSDHDPVIIGLDFCDEIAPTLEVSVTPTQLWPVNHRVVQVVATVMAADNFDPHPTVTLVSVTSNEPDEGLATVTCRTTL